MISTSLARRLRDAGLRWKPASGDRFQIDRPELDADVFTVSDLTIEPHEYPTGTVLGFNGTTEWALDSVAVEDALWLPREDQLRDLLRAAFTRLERDGDDYRVVLRGADGHEVVFTSVSAPEAYGLALLSMLERVTA
ncbi:pilus assembly protein CpaE [Microcella alkalica]|uniref:pilus assembly protein CpaE n=1 Tax=Microcella alkalica TaxID=355930 RepID=UPI00145D3D40|nr:pilus assembly protein CpaE [Microcella alkalica]